MLNNTISVGTRATLWNMDRLFDLRWKLTLKDGSNNSKPSKGGHLFTICLLTCLNIILLVCSINMQKTDAAPQGPVMLAPHQAGATFDPDEVQLARLDDEGNVYFDVYPIRGDQNKFMYAKNGVLIVQIQNPDEVQDTFERELWYFITSTLGVEIADVDILLFPFQAGRRVLMRRSKLTVKQTEDKIRDVLKPYLPVPSQTPGQTEPPPLLSPHDPLAIYAQNDTNDKSGVLKYYEVTLPKEEKTGKRTEPIPRKELVKMKPYYGKDPSWMGKILRDLRPNKEVVIRGRLLPGTPLRPMIDDYRGPGKVKIVRKILQGIADGSGIPKPKNKLRFEMSHPVPAVMMLDYLSPNKEVVVSRRVVTPLFSNDTVDFVEELEYTEVE